MHKPLYCRKTAGLPQRHGTMGNHICCGGSCKRRKLSWETNGVGSGESWKYTTKKKHEESFPSTFQRKKKPGSQARQTLKQQQQLQQQNGTKGPETPGRTYKRVLEHPKSQERTPRLCSEGSSLHYADIQLFSHSEPHSAQGMKHLRSENTVEYAILRFPQVTPHYDSRNGTLV
ncbi:uncharacterized protein C11orf52 homolog [Choloepus didactylus]|uniref:uncharacterized protein C11orf52 homolog n=1 Tax=Choloepus didactylus TaxID=27675 RepID=UPI00189F2EE6|nr:uncharacterized protein C11orf52 homolog [Choloepus didactylus]